MRRCSVDFGDVLGDVDDTVVVPDDGEILQHGRKPVGSVRPMQ